MLSRRQLLAAAAGTAALASTGPVRANNHPWPPQGGADQLKAERVLGQTAIPVYGYRIAATYPHDRDAYTEGLVKVGASIFEGTGLYGRSKLREWELKTGRLLREVDLDPHYFGEGVTVLGEQVFQLTYLDNRAFVYDRATLRREDELRYANQGWGLTHDGASLIMSNGSAAIEYRDPKTFAVTRHFFVADAVGPVGFLNELEYAGGRLYANVWQSNFIAILDPAAGKLIGWIDLTGLNADPERLVYPFVLNGIAWNEDTGRLLVTGKCWPHVWEIDLVPR